MGLDRARRRGRLTLGLGLILAVSSPGVLPFFQGHKRLWADEPAEKLDLSNLKKHFLGLSAETWKEREEHSLALVAAGPGIIEPLRTLSRSADDPELLIRVRAIIDLIERREREAIVARRAAAVAKMGKGYIGINISNGRTPGGEFGIEITSLIPGLPGERCGLRNGDIVVFADGVRVSDTSELITVVSAIPAGDRVKIVVQRGAARLSFEPELAARPQEPAAPRPEDPEGD